MAKTTIMLLGDGMAFLCISLNGSRVNTVHLIDGDVLEIDKYTTKYDTAKSLLKEYPDKIDELNNRYHLDGAAQDIKVRIFLSNDKEQFVMYRKHLIAFKVIIKNRSFLRYVVGFDNTIFKKKQKEIIMNENIDNDDAFRMIKSLIEEMTEDEYYNLVRSICVHYDNYLEDDPNSKNLTIDGIYKKYLAHLKEWELSKTSEIIVVKNKAKPINPFAVFEHPNFFKKYGTCIDNSRPIFILGGKMNESMKHDYEELYNNCKKCFRNPIYSPLNANVACPLNEEFASFFDTSLLVIVNGNDFNKDLDKKIDRASSKGITVLILTEENEEFFNSKYSNNDMVVVKNYEFNDVKSQKIFADLAAGLYINEYKKKAVGV